MVSSDAAAWCNRVITLASTLIITDITRTSSNYCLKLYSYTQSTKQNLPLGAGGAGLESSAPLSNS